MVYLTSESQALIVVLVVVTQLVFQKRFRILWGIPRAHADLSRQGEIRLDLDSEAAMAGDVGALHIPT